MKKTNTLKLYVIIFIAVLHSSVHCVGQEHKAIKGINAALNIHSGNDSTRTTHASIGIMSSLKRMDGVNINLIGSGIKEDMNGFMFSGLVSTTGGKAKGVQIGMLANVVGNDASGVMFGGMVNASGKTTRGLQIATISNIAEDAAGVQLSAFSNIASLRASGTQICGIMNIAREMDRAVQIAGIANVGMDSVSGVQIAPGNYAGTLNKGVQIGLLNLCGGEVKGVQVGIINYSNDTTAHKIGLVNINPQTRMQMLVAVGNISKTNIAVRFMNRHDYSIIGFGTHYLGLDDKFSGCIFYRTGLRKRITPVIELSGDIGFFHVENFENEDSYTPERMYSLQVRANIEFRISKRLSAFASCGYASTRYYDRNKEFESKPIMEVGVALF